MEKNELDGHPNSGTSATSDKVELYKMEYEKCAERYDNLYKAVWTNFSYMVLVSGGLLTFGGAHFRGSIIIFVATLPLVFWFWATFVPLNWYGDQVGTRLMWIEKVINQQFGLSFDEAGELGSHSGLRHFTEFSDRNPPWRVRTVVYISSAVLHLVVLGSFGFGAYKLYKGEPLQSSTAPTQIEIQQGSKPLQIETREPSNRPSNSTSPERARPSPQPQN